MNGFPRPDRDGEEGRKRAMGRRGAWAWARAEEKPMAADATRRCLALCTFALRGVERLGQGEFGRFVGRGGAGFDLVEPGEQFSDGDV